MYPLARAACQSVVSLSLALGAIADALWYSVVYARYGGTLATASNREHGSGREGRSLRYGAT